MAAEGIVVAHMGCLVVRAVRLGSRVWDAVLGLGLPRLLGILFAPVHILMAIARIVVGTVARGGHVRHLHGVLHVVGRRYGPLRLVQMVVLGVEQSVVGAEATARSRSARVGATQVLRAVGPWGLFRGR